MRTLFISCFFLFSSYVHSQSFPASGNWGGYGWSHAGSTVATAFDHVAFYNNPAGLAGFDKKTSLNGYYLEGTRDLNQWSASVVDGLRQAIGGFAFDWLEYGNVTRMGMHVAAARKTQYGSIGVAVNLYHFKDQPTNNGWHFTQTFGIFVPIAYGLAFAASTQALLDNAKDSVLPPEAKLGLVYHKPGMLRLSFQADRRFQIPNQDWNFSFSTDLYFKKFFSVRGAYRMENTVDDGSLFSAGLNMNAPRMTVFGFYTREVKTSDDGFGFQVAFKY